MHFRYFRKMKSGNHMFMYTEVYTESRRNAKISIHNKQHIETNNYILNKTTFSNIYIFINYILNSTNPFICMARLCWAYIL